MEVEQALYQREMDFKAKWKYHFVLYTVERPYRLYAEKKTIRDKWMTALKKIIANLKQEKIRLVTLKQPKPEKI